MNSAIREVSFVDSNGISLPPAFRLVRVARTFSAHTVAWCGGERINLQSLDGTNLLPARCTDLKITAKGPDAQATLAALANLILAANSGLPLEDHRGVGRNGQLRGTHAPG
jgi:phosphotransferase system HPr-like phosphotransfer protein